MGDAILFMGLLGALTVGGLLLVFLVLRNRLDGLTRDLEGVKREVEAVGRSVTAAADRIVNDAEARSVGLLAVGSEVTATSESAAPAAPSEPIEQTFTVDIAGQLDPLHDELGRMRGEFQGLVRRVGEIGTALESERGRRLGDTIRDRFERQGFRSIRFLTEPTELEEPESRVALEGVKGGITYKGYVVVEDGRVVDEKMTSSYEVFP